MAVQHIESLAGARPTSVGGEVHKKIRSAKETLPFQPNEAGPIIAGCNALLIDRQSGRVGGGAESAEGAGRTTVIPPPKLNVQSRE